MNHQTPISGRENVNVLFLRLEIFISKVIKLHVPLCGLGDAPDATFLGKTLKTIGKFGPP